MSAAQVNLPNRPGRVVFTYLPGQGRAENDIYGIIRRQELRDGDDIVSERLQTELRLNLSRYIPESRSLNVTGNPPNQRFLSRSFDNYTLDLQSIGIEQADGSLNVISNPSGSPVVLENFPASIRAFPSRETTVPVFVDDAMVTTDGSNVTFNRSLFEQSNFTDRNQMEGFLGDYVRFDIGAVTNKPTLRAGGNASVVYFSGDNIALSRPTAGVFEVLVPEANQVISGLVGNYNAMAQQGTYALTQTDPSDVNQIAKIVSVQGSWRPYTQVISNMAANGFEFFAFPDRDDAQVQDIALIQRRNGTIVDMYFGVVNFGDSVVSGLQPNRFRAWPVRNLTILPPGNLAGEIGGTVHSLVTLPGQGDSGPRVYEGRYTVAATNKPAAFPAAGRFIVFRR